MDGGWYKRSLKRCYNAMSGVAIIIGAETRKILYTGFRNKYCAACVKSIPPDKNKCYRNWNESSSQMETDIILEEFHEAERVHGVRYMSLLVMVTALHSTVIENASGWGRSITKLECTNHAWKCYRGLLERLIQDNPSYKGNGGLTQKMGKR